MLIDVNRISTYFIDNQAVEIMIIMYNIKKFHKLGVRHPFRSNYCEEFMEMIT